MKVIKRLSNEKYLGKDGKEYNYKNYYLLLDNGKEIPICVNVPGKSDKAIAYKKKMYEYLELVALNDTNKN